MTAPFDPQRFLDAQARLYEQALAELTAGHKASHWMWFVFPQLAGLGRSDMAHYYGLSGLDAARAYAAHPLLGARLRACTAAVLAHGPGSAAPRGVTEIFGHPDDRKFCSSMTLFARAAPEEALFAAALDGFCGGEPDAASLALL